MKCPYVDIHTHRRSGDGIEFVSVSAGCGAALPGLPGSMGIHPRQLTDDGGDGAFGDAELTAALQEIAAADVNAIGEIGLDFAVSGDYALQEQAFIAQLHLAEVLQKPVILHCVKAFERTMTLLADFRLTAVIFHGFIGSKQQAEHATDRGYHLSFGERSLNSPKTVEAMKHIPRERMFLETDESTLSIAEIHTRVAAALGLSVTDLAKRLYNNYRTVFEDDDTLA